MDVPKFSRGVQPGAKKGLSPEQIIRLVSQPELRAADIPGLGAVAQQLVGTPEDPYLQDLFQLQMQNQMGRALVAQDPFYANYPPVGTILTTGDVVDVGVMPTGDPLKMPVARARCNIAILGRTGSGKTTLAEYLVSQLVGKGFCVIVFDQKRRWRRLLRNPALQGKVVVLRIEHLKFVFLKPPPGGEEQSWANIITRVTAEAYGRVYAQRLLREVIDEVLALKKAGYWPTLKSLIHKLRAFKPGQGYREAGYRESVLWTLIDIKNILGTAFRFRDSDFMERLLMPGRLVVVEVPGLPTAHLAFLISYMQQWCFHHRLQNPSARNLPLLFVLEDATSLLDVQRDRETPGGTSLLAEGTLLSREQNFGAIFILHGVTSVSPKILQNCESFFVCASQGEDDRVLQRLLGTTPETTAAIRLLRPGQEVASIPNIWPLPVLVTSPSMKGDWATDAECEASAEQFLSGVTAVEAVVLPQSDGDQDKADGSSSAVGGRPGGAAIPLTGDEVRILVLAGKRVPPSMTAIYSQAGLSRGQGGKCVKDLEKKGMVALHDGFATGKRGGPLTLLEVTDRGWEALATRGIERPKALTRGSWEHNLVAAALGEIGQRQKAHVDYEVDLGGVRVDVEWRNPTGKRTFFQVGLSKPEREVEAVEKALKVPALANGQLVLVVRDTAFAQRVSSLFKARDPTGQTEKKVLVRLVGQVLEAYYAAGSGSGIP
jgi:hypothetical protein